ncbi:MAG: AAA family ATPase [Planctomycetaceae bacterium]|nr:AAA family ATPase [Planctomycetaceae bacterium]
MRRRNLIDETQYKREMTRYHWNATPPADDGLLWPPGFWEPETNPDPRQPAPGDRLVPLDDLNASPPDWLWPQRIPRGKLTLLTGQGGDGKSIVAADLIARVTTGADWPDGSENKAANAFLLSPEHGLRDIVLPRLRTAGVNLTLTQLISTVAGESQESKPFQFPAHGPLLEEIVRSRKRPGLLLIDSLSEFLDLPSDPTARQRHLQEVLFDLETLADTHDVAVICVETVRPGGIVPLPHKNQWRADYDPTFKAVWGVARDPRDRQRRLLLPIRHHLGDDRLGFQFSIVPDADGIAAVEWGEPDDSITFAEAIGRVRLGRSVWSFSQTAQAESWLRQYLAAGEKKSVEIFSDARKAGFTQHPVRDALNRVARKFKQGQRGPWSWRLLEND